MPRDEEPRHLSLAPTSPLPLLPSSPPPDCKAEGQSITTARPRPTSYAKLFSTWANHSRNAALPSRQQNLGFGRGQQIKALAFAACIVAKQGQNGHGPLLAIGSKPFQFVADGFQIPFGKGDQCAARGLDRPIRQGRTRRRGWLIRRVGDHTRERLEHALAINCPRNRVAGAVPEQASRASFPAWCCA